MVKAFIRVLTVFVCLILLFSCRMFFCESAFALFPGNLLASSDVIVFGGDNGDEIVHNSTEITLEMETIATDLYWTGSQDDVDALLIRTLARSAGMDAVFHLP